jgi:Na+-transporting methylmalonyl-CoA/oxaloacetate decarboxylase beta subunit
VTNNLHDAPDWSPPVRIKDKSLLYLATARALECVLLIPCYHFGIVFSDLNEAHFFTARNAPHCRDPLFDRRLLPGRRNDGIN